jgi:phenylacetaldehyde dehydrogenase
MDVLDHVHQPDPPMLYRPSSSVEEFLKRPPRLLINGEWVPATRNGRLAVINPSTGLEFAEVAAGDENDIDQAVAAARRAFDHGPWRLMGGAQRASLIWRLSDLLMAHADELAEIETLDNGKPLRDTRQVDLPVGCELLRYYAGWATKLKGETTQIGDPGDYQAYTLREPIGVVGQIIPWNFPLLMAILKIAPALAAGCTLVLKPAEETPLSALRLGDLVVEAGFPPGVVNIVTGFGETAGAALAQHFDVDKIAFTGSTEVGRKIIAAAAGNLKRVSLELGGKSPMIVMPDADLDAVIRGATTGIFFNSGQSCMAGSRLLVHRACYDQVVEAIAARAEKIIVGDGFATDSQIGPLVSAVQKSRVEAHINSGLAEGAELLAGGRAVSGPGYFVRPTVFAGVTPSMRIMREEIFGPVLCAMPFDGEDVDAIAALANHSNYGLAASIWTRDIATAHALIPRLKSGQVWINGHHVGGADLPMGGYKQSGWGRELGRDGVEAYTEIKSVAFALRPAGDWLSLKG